MQKMPELKPRVIAPVEPLHHSANVDWDWSHDDYELTTEQYVSEPKCLKWQAPTTPWRQTLCKHAGTTVLNEGRVVSWLRTTIATANPAVMFRNQAAVGTANYLNMYILNFAPNLSQIQLGKFVGGSGVGIDSNAFGGGFTFPINTWRKVRVTWWETGGVMYVRVEWYHDTEWTNICDELFDADNMWSGETVNRCGLHFGGAGGVVYADDTEVWGP